MPTLKERFNAVSKKSLLLITAGVVTTGTLVAGAYYLYPQHNTPSSTTPSTATSEIALKTAWQDEHDICLMGCPVLSHAKNKTISRSVYVLSNNAETKFADWVAYTVSNDSIGTTQKRSWKKDLDLPVKETLGPHDYKNVSQIGMDRGHQAPLASLTGKADWEKANYMSNITPQGRDLNQGPWENLERAERKLAKTFNMTVYSVTGPLYEREMPKLPKATLDHIIPSGYWKVVAVKEGEQIMLASFIMNQTMGMNDNHCDTATTVRTIEQRARINLFPNLSKKAQEELETKSGELVKKLGCR